MRKKQMHIFNVFTGNSPAPFRVWANHPAHAMAKFRKETGATNFGSDENGGWKGYTVSIEN